jgi:cell wall-associated NlpC family hydrolase
LRKHLTVVFLICVGLLVAPSASAGEQSPADVAIARAKSVTGTRYVLGGASPRHGFDCSGLTMWAWGKAGAVLPHNSFQQSEATHNVHRKHLKPGDLLFFFHPIHHVAIYLGNGRMIHANHAGGRVKRQHVYWQYFVVGGRPEVDAP